MSQHFTEMLLDILLIGRELRATDRSVSPSSSNFVRGGCGGPDIGSGGSGILLQKIQKPPRQSRYLSRQAPEARVSGDQECQVQREVGILAPLHPYIFVMSALDTGNGRIIGCPRSARAGRLKSLDFYR